MNIKKILLILLFLNISALSQTTQISWNTFSTGYSESASGNIFIKSIAGQPFVGTESSGTSIIGSGFFYNPDAAGKITSINDFEIGIPSVYELHQNYPNPFNPSTVISYQLPVAGYVTLKIYDILGREAAKLVNKEQQAGDYKIKFDGANLPSGIYFYELSTENLSDGRQDFHQTKKMILLK